MSAADETLDIHHPIYPLPAEILKMQRDETVCKFCGVSYLIHTEIKKLEEKIEKLESKLKDYESLKEREKQAKSIIDEQNNKIEELDSILLIKNQLISSLNNDIESKQMDFNRLQIKLNEYDSEINFLNVTNERLKKNILLMNSFLNETKFTLTQQKSALKSIELMNQNQMSEFKDSVGLINYHLKFLNSKDYRDSSEQKEEINQMRSKLNQLNNENQSKNSEISALNKQIDSLKQIRAELNLQLNLLNDEITKSKNLNNLLIKLEDEKRNLMQINHDYKAKNDELDIKYRNKISELNEMSEKLKNSESYIKDLKINFENMNKKSGNDLVHIERELKAKNEEVYKIKEELELNKKFLQEKEKKYENDMFNNSQSNIAEIGQLKAENEVLKKQMVDIETEKNAMILAYQCQITQLKENFKEKQKHNENWSEKLAVELNKERDKYNQQAKSVEAELKKNLQMELEIQEQKYKDLLSKYQTNTGDVEIKSKEKLAKYQHDLSILQEQFKLVHEEKVNNESKYKYELDNLRKITKELHESLEKYTNLESNDELINRLKKDSFEKESLMHELKTTLDQKENEAKQLQEEVRVLQETVHHECLERQELHDKLEQTREELLNLKKLSYSTSQIIPIPNLLPKPANSQKALIDVNHVPLQPQQLPKQLNNSYPRNLNELSRDMSNYKQTPSTTINSSNSSGNSSGSYVSNSLNSEQSANINNNQQMKKSNKYNLAPIQNSNKSLSPQNLTSLYDENRRRISLLMARK